MHAVERLRHIGNRSIRQAAPWMLSAMARQVEPRVPTNRVGGKKACGIPPETEFNVHVLSIAWEAGEPDVPEIPLGSTIPDIKRDWVIELCRMQKPEEKLMLHEKLMEDDRGQKGVDPRRMLQWVKFVDQIGDVSSAVRGGPRMSVPRLDNAHPWTAD